MQSRYLSRTRTHRGRPWLRGRADSALELVHTRRRYADAAGNTNAAICFPNV